MPKIYVHDYKFDYFEIEKSHEDDFYCSVNVYFNFSKDDSNLSMNNLEYFNISVATPSGFAKYLQKCINQGIFADIFLFRSTVFVRKKEEQKIMSFLKAELENIYGRSEKELLLKALRKFTWESEYLPEVMNKLYK